ncbi:MAG: TetR/AcrR family transcriptional regulator [candidate division Zixibacteria bacterium]|nr:TetR/AcrR family transcriptional regulator [candidate division Zixibacteria bacterium]MDH3937888.1 TetR/AcrR family transcriptional regulator [candidate division Zixibacteria bacterium]MDH4035289.1 TetR/AcrR family transcriptional regulator [candidate division Zixibacteria bacterium]
MSKIKQSPKLPPEKRREQLLASARKLFVKKGYRGTTTDEIAKSARLTKGALYFHFKSKEDIFLELIKSITDHNRATLEAELDTSVSPSEFFGILLKLHHKCDVNEYGDLVDIWTQAWRVPRIRRYITRRMRSTVELFADRVKLGPGWTKNDVHTLAMFIFALVHGLSGLRMLTPRDVNLEAQVKLMETLFERSTTRQQRKRR